MGLAGMLAHLQGSAGGHVLDETGHEIRPQWHTFVAYACEWEPIPDDGLERYPEGKPR